MTQSLEDELATAAAALEAEIDPHLSAALTAFVDEHDPPPSGALSQRRAAAALGLSRRRLRVLLSLGQLRPTDQGELIAAHLREQLDQHRARVGARRGRRE